MRICVRAYSGDDGGRERADVPLVVSHDALRAGLTN